MTYLRTVYLADTDAAGVVYFANVLVMCHEAYEKSLLEFGINLQELVSKSSIAIPIVHSSVDFFSPIFWGEELLIDLVKKQLNQSKFEISYYIFKNLSNKKIAQAKTRHVAINANNRQRIALPERIIQWLNDEV